MGRRARRVLAVLRPRRSLSGGLVFLLSFLVTVLVVRAIIRRASDDEDSDAADDSRAAGSDLELVEDDRGPNRQFVCDQVDWSLVERSQVKSRDEAEGKDAGSHEGASEAPETEDRSADTVVMTKPLSDPDADSAGPPTASGDDELRASDPLWRHGRRHLRRLTRTKTRSILTFAVMVAVLALGLVWLSPRWVGIGGGEGTNADPTSAEDEEAAESGGDGTSETVVATPTEADITNAAADAGFPDIDVLVNGHTVVLTGEVSDEASRRALLELVLGLEGVEQVDDALTLQGQPIAGMFRVTVTDTGVQGSGTAADRTLVTVLSSILEERFPSDLVDMGGVDYDVDLETTAVVVAGEVTDPELAEELGRELEAEVDQLGDEGAELVLSYGVAVRRLESWERNADGLLADADLFVGDALASGEELDLAPLIELVERSGEPTVLVAVHVSGRDALERSQARADSLAQALAEAARADNSLRVDFVPVGFGDLRHWPGAESDRAELRAWPPQDS